jgi:endonuclease/exonuclease/phosphatase family metal-dependent hydrolase
MIRRILKILLSIIVVFALAFGGLLLYGTLTDYKPDDVLDVKVDGMAEMIPDSTVNLLIWNIGYGGLGAESDFFYDGGKMVRPSKENFEKNLHGIIDFVQTWRQTCDYILLQEVDLKSKRSFRINQVEQLNLEMDEFCNIFGMNYFVRFVPIPFTSPMGRVEGGLVTYSLFNPEEAKRYQFPGNYNWPMRIYMLDRCFLTHRKKLENGKDLLVINTHNSAYDDGGLKKQQMAFMKEFLKKEYEAGNYVIVGGDWNQCPPGFDPYTYGKDDDYTQDNIPEDYLPGWTWAFDAEVPTNRKLSAPFVLGKTFTTVIDFYLVSPNVEVIKTQGIDLDFEFSDHQPVYLEVKLR